jgi:hypothetical protein
LKAPTPVFGPVGTPNTPVARAATRRVIFMVVEFDGVMTSGDSVSQSVLYKYEARTKYAWPGRHPRFIEAHDTRPRRVLEARF